MTAHREIEDKYEVDDDVVLPDLDGLKHVASVESVAQVLEATYFDTPDLALASAGITLRRRTGGDDDGWHLKLPTDGGRHEVRISLDRAKASVPKQLRDLVWAHTRAEELVAAVTLHTHRAEHRLLDLEGAVLAVVCEDVVTAESTGPLATWREWEVELGQGKRSLLASVGRLLLGAGARRSSASSKLERALAGRLPETDTTRPHRKKSPAATLVQARLVEQVDELLRRDPLVRASAPGGVHKMRVATRTLRSNLATYRPVLDRDETDPLRDELKWLGQALGVLRDCEVQAEHLRRSLDELAGSGHPELIRGPVRSRLTSATRSEHKEARAALLETLTSPRYAALLDRLATLRDDPPWAPEAQSSVRSVLTPRVRRDLKRLEQQARLARSGDGDRSPDERLHDVRKAAKRARYAAEPLVAIYGKDAARLVKATKRVQAVLGEHQDTVAARAHLRQLADLASRNGEDTFTYGVLHELEQQRATRLEAEFATVWKHLPTKKMRRRLT